MKATHRNIMLLGMSILLVGGWVIATETPDVTEERPNLVPAIVPGSPHRSPELLGLPHIDLASSQKRKIETIVRNNQGGVHEVNRALREAEKALQEAKESGRPKLIELAAANLGQAIGDKAVLDVTVVAAIKNVLTERQLAALTMFNLKSRVWFQQGLFLRPLADANAVDAQVDDVVMD